MEQGLLKKESGILFGIFLAIAIMFFVSLSIVNPKPLSGTGQVVFSPDEGKNFNFGIVEILSSVAFAFFMTGFLLWIKSIMKKNEYLGAIIGVLIAFVLGYAFSLRYRGYYSTGFVSAAGAVVFVYLSMNFFRYKNINISKA